MFFSGDYAEFLQPDAEIPAHQNIHPSSSYLQRGHFMSSQDLQAQHDMVYSEFTETIVKRLLVSAYPSNFINCNPFCPICLKIVRNNNQFFTCYINDERNYLIHSVCLEKDKSYQMRHVGEILDNCAVFEEQLQKPRKMFNFNQESKHFYLEISFNHPIHEKSFFKVNKRLTSGRNELSVDFNQVESQSYFPNIAVLPLTDFHLNVSLMEFSRKDSRVKYCKYVSLRNAKGLKTIKVQCQEVGFAAEIIRDGEEKENLLQKMNYKYKFQAQGMAVLRINNISVKLPEDFQSEEDEEFIIGSSTNIVEDLLNQKQPSVVSTIKSSSQSPLKQKSDSNTSQEVILDTDQVNLETLINTKGLIAFVKNNIQSRLFQNYLEECGEKQIETVIINIKDNFLELIMHEYGNYMMQKLFSVCRPYQRMDILQTILPHLGDLIRNKQGTHTIQKFIEEFTTHEEYTLIVMQLGPEYYDLCRNSNATHFVQKVIKTFPLQYILAYFSYTVENLLSFALDKNAMCVIKHMIRRFRQLQGRQGDYYIQMQLIRRQLLTHVTFSVERLIMDNYGNYVIQFCYELFDLDKCSGITSGILSRFASYSVGKFSSNVILKCISSYWTDKNIYTSLKGLPNNQVVQIFRNKDGNKILLEIMEKLEGSQLWDRLYSILIRLQPTRFYHDRWGVCLGCRSGQVGGRITGFPEPKARYRHKK